VPTPTDAQDFLFERPNLVLTVFGGYASPGTEGEFFDDIRSKVAVARTDPSTGETEFEDITFDSPSIMGELAFRVTERLDVAVGVEHAEGSARSELIDYLTADDQPIAQTNEFSRTRLMATGKVYLFERGRSISQFSWVPNRWSPYAGGGAGITWYEFAQTGDFVNEETLDIFEDIIDMDGRGYSAHALGGVQLSLTPRFLVRGEYHYIWGGGEVGDDFVGYQEDIDLSGWRALIGASIRF
jgi:hypothetical protein